MTQYFFVDESGDPGFYGGTGSSSHFGVAMIQLPNRAPLDSLAHVRQALGFPDTFEFKYHKTAPAPKDFFFSEVLSIPFRVRAVVVDKKQLLLNWRQLADMIAGAIRLYVMGGSSDHFYCISQRIVDLWQLS